MAKRAKRRDQGLGDVRPTAAGLAPGEDGPGDVRPEATAAPEIDPGAPLNRAERRHPRDSTKAPRPAR